MEKNSESSHCVSSGDRAFKKSGATTVIDAIGRGFLVCVSEGCVIFCRIIKASSSSVGRSFVFWQHRKLNRRVDKLMDFDLCSCSLISSDEQLDRQDRITQHYEPLSSSSSYFSSARYPSTPLSFIDRRGIGPPEWTEQLLLHLVSPTSNSIAPSFFSPLS